MRRLTFRFTIRRMMLGTVFVAMAFAAFGSYGTVGIILSTMISVQMFIACCIATRAQLHSMMIIIGCTAIGMLLDSLYVHPRVRAPQMGWTLCGLVIGIIWSEALYTQRTTRDRLN